MKTRFHLGVDKNSIMPTTMRLLFCTHELWLLLLYTVTLVTFPLKPRIPLVFFVYWITNKGFM